MLHRQPRPQPTPAPPTAVWAFNDATVAATPFARECTGGALVLRCLHDLPAALTQLEQLRSQTGGTRTVCLLCDLVGRGCPILSRQHWQPKPTSLPCYPPSPMQAWPT